jgi:hypothetical protein
MAPGIGLEIPGLDKTVNMNMTWVPQGGGTRPQKLRGASWGLL